MVSHTRIMPSMPPAATQRPLGLMATARSTVAAALPLNARPPKPALTNTIPRARVSELLGGRPTGPPRRQAARLRRGIPGVPVAVTRQAFALGNSELASSSRAPCCTVSGGKRCFQFVRQPGGAGCFIARLIGIFVGPMRLSRRPGRFFVGSLAFSIRRLRKFSSAVFAFQLATCAVTM